MHSGYVFKGVNGKLHLQYSLDTDPKFERINKYEDYPQLKVKTKRILNLLNDDSSLWDVDLETDLWNRV